MKSEAVYVWWGKTFKSSFTHPGASLWGPLKELWETVDGAVLRRQPESVHLLDLQLKKHKSHFLSLFRNPVRFFVLLSFHIWILQWYSSRVSFHSLGADRHDMRYVFWDCNLNNTRSFSFLIFSQRVQSRERRCVKPAQKASPSKVSRGHGSFQNSFSKRPSSSVTCLILESWQLWSSSWQVMWTWEKVMACKQIYQECDFANLVSAY